MHSKHCPIAPTDDPTPDRCSFCKAITAAVEEATGYTPTIYHPQADKIAELEAALAAARTQLGDVQAERNCVHMDEYQAVQERLAEAELGLGEWKTGVHADSTGHLYRCAKVNGVWQCAEGCQMTAMMNECDTLKARVQELEAIDAASVAGADACFREKPREYNPHPEGSLRISWWGGYAPSWLLRRLRAKTNELARALARRPIVPDQIIHEAADVANFAMFIADKIHRKYLDPQERG